MEKTRKWRKILAMMLTVVMMLQNAQSVMVFADVTNEQIEQRLAGNQGQTEETQPAQSQVDTRANGEEYKTQSQETQENGNGSTDIGSPESGNATTEAKTSNADVSATITQSVSQADVSGTTCNFVQMTAQITNNDAENPATGVSVKALLNSAQLSWVNGYGTETAGAGAYAVDSNNTADLPDGSADGYDQIVMWTDQTIGAGETVAYQFAAQIIPENLDGVVNAWYVNGTSCNYTWENTEVLNPVQTPEADQEETPSDTTQDSNQSSNQDSNQDSTQEATPTPEVAEETTATPTPEVTEESTSEATETPEAEPTQAADDKKAKAAKKKNQQRLLAQRGMEDGVAAQDENDDNTHPAAGVTNSEIEDKNILKTGNTVTSKIYVNDKEVDITDPNFKLKRDDLVSVELTYRYSEANKPTKTDNIRYYELPGTGWTFDVPSDTIWGPRGAAGSYSVNGNLVTFVYDNSEGGFLHNYPNEIAGTFTLYLSVDKEATSNTDKITFDFPGMESSVDVNLDSSNLPGTKNYETDSDGNIKYDENGYITYHIVLTPESANVNDVKVTDTISSNFEFVDGSFKLDGNTITDIVYSNNNQTVTLGLGNLNYEQGKSYDISYKVKPRGQIEDFNLENKASWSWDNGRSNGAPSSKVSVENDLLKKTGQVIEKRNRVKYTVEFNKLRAKLFPDNVSNTKVELRDVIDSQVTLDLDSINIVAGTGVSTTYDPSTRLLTIFVPDETYAKIEYEVQASGVEGTPIKLSNKIEVSGRGDISSTAPNEFKIKRQSATVTGKNGTYRIIKRSAYSASDGKQPSLQGAVFELWRCDFSGNGNEYTETKIGDTYETDTNGEITFRRTEQDLQKDTLYYYIEISAPTNYILDTQKHYFILDATEKMKTRISTLGLKPDYNVDGGYNDVTNDTVPAKEEYSLSVTKKLDGEEVKSGDQFQFNMKLKSYSPSGTYKEEKYEDGNSNVKDSNTDALKIERDGNGKVSLTSRYNNTVTVNNTVTDSDTSGVGKAIFKDIKFYYEGTYQFEVSETANTNSEYIYDTKKYTVTFVVERDKSDNGNLIIKQSPTVKSSDTKETANVDTITFNNYTATKLNIQKKTTEAVNEDTTFTFKLTGEWTNNNSVFDFENVKVGNNPVNYNSQTGEAQVIITVNKGKKSGEVILTGIPKGVIITVNESKLAGWKMTTDPSLLTVSMNDKEKQVIVNNTYSENGEIAFDVSKTFNDWKAEISKFTFKLLGLKKVTDNGNTGDNKVPMPEGNGNEVVISSNRNGNNTQTKSFGTIKYEKNGTYYYKIVEEIPADTNGINYDTSVTYVKVVVTSKGAGNKDIAISTAKADATADYKNLAYKSLESNAATATFTNNVSGASIRFTATKSLTGRALKDGDFTFKVVDKDNSGKEVATGYSKADGTIEFTPISYKSTELDSNGEKEYHYTISEVDDKKTGIVYDKTSYDVTVKVSKNTDGTLKVECGNQSNTSDQQELTYAIPVQTGKMSNFENSFTASTSIQFTGTKVLLNKELQEKQFSFIITDENNQSQFVQNDGNGNIIFPVITYHQSDLIKDGTFLKERTYRYEIEEDDANKSDNPGITYSDKRYVVTVALSLTDEGTLKTDVKVNDGNGEQSISQVGNNKGTEDNPLVYALTKDTTFINEYNADSIKVKLVGTKKLENQELTEGAYKFKIVADNGTPSETIDGNTSVSNASDGKISFPTLKFDLNAMKEGNYPASSKTFEYTISEEKGNVSSVTYGEEEYHVEITVRNNKGSLSATGKITQITNTDGVEINPGIVVAELRGIDKDTEKTFDITPNKNSFTNVYNATTIVQFKGIKSLVDTISNSKQVDKDSFEFEISGPKLGTDGKSNGKQKVKCTTDGEFVFPDIAYVITDLKDKDGNYQKDESGNYTNSFTYTVNEVIPDGATDNVKNGITYDTKTYTVVVTITDDQTGELKQFVAIKAGTDGYVTGGVTNNKGVYTLSAGENKATFTNRYDATTKYTFTVEKQLAGRKFKDGDNFRFALLKGRTELQTIELKVGGENGVKVETDENGNQYLVGTFDAQEYGLSDVGKSYEYTIRELNPKKAMDGVTTDEDIYIVDVAITDNGDGTLKAEPKRVLGDKDKGETKVTFDKAVFTNKYQAEGTALIVGKKFLSPGEIGEEKFEFTLSQLKEDGTTTILQKKENIGNVIEFDSIPYKTEDEGKTFWYIVQETTGTNQKYAYDNSVYKVKVVVSMDPKDNRKLIANQTIYDITGKQLSESGEEAKAIVFTNRYEAAGSITLTGKKVVEGTDKLKAGEFKFKVKEGVGENAKVVATGTNDENGNITFSEISYAYNSKNNDLGEHVYTVTEVQPKDGDGYVYDLTSRKVVVKVTDNQDKTLKAEIIAASEKDAELKSDVTNNVINSFINKQISITIRKNDANKARLADAELALFEYDNEKKAKTGDAIDTWTTSKDNDHTITGKLVAGKTYILEETKAPDGYAEANPIIFTIKNDGVRTIEVVSGGQLDETGKVLIMVDQKTGVQILKVDEKGKGVPGAELAIFDGDKQIGASWTTDGQAHVIEGLTAGKTYTLKELKAPSGYKKAEDKTFTIDASKVVEVRMEDKTIKLSIMKVDGNGQGLKGADLEIRNKNNELIDKWTSETTEHVVDEEKSRKLVEGEEYTLIETKAPEGYALANPKTFTIKSSDTVTKVTMENVPNSVIISKKSLTGIESIGGAKLRVLDPQGNEVVKTWTTEKGKDKAVTGVFKPNVTYTLEEVEAPEGYRKAANIMFSLNETGEIYVGNTKVTSVVMRDALTKASILKVDESGKGIAGADLVIKDSKGNIKATWTSDGTPHAVEGVLKVGETYTLSETKAPSGYTVAPDQTFKMEDKDVIEVTMVDYQASGSGQITVTKKVTYANGGDFIDLIAQDDTFYVNLFTDAAGKYPYKGALPQAIHLVNASAGSVTFSDLAQGTYYVYETDANGNVINLDQQGMHNGSQFMCTVDGGSNIVKLDLKAGPKEGAVNLENVFFDIPTGYSYKGEININKQVLKGTTQTTTDDTFYAGVFTKGDDGVYNLFTVVTLVQNDTVTVEVPLGGKDGTEPINYYILETDADGNILDLDVFEYEVTGEGTVALSKDNLAGNINLVNKIPEDTDGKLRVQKTDGNGVGLAGASFRLTDEDGSVIDEWTSEASAHELELEPGTYTLTEVQAPTGYTGAGSVTIKVDDDYNFSVSGEIDYSYKGGLLKIVNKATTSTPSSGTPVSGGSTPASYSSALSGKVAVKTGDNTPIGAYAAVLVIAALAIAGGIFYKKKRKNDK